MLNRLGAAIPDGLIFALKSDTVLEAPVQLKARQTAASARVARKCRRLPDDHVSQIGYRSNFNTNPATKYRTTEVSLHIQGMEWVTGAQDDGSFVGINNSSLASATPSRASMPPQTQTYTLFARQEGTFLIYTMGDTSTDGDQMTQGLFGA